MDISDFGIIGLMVKILLIPDFRFSIFRISETGDSKLEKLRFPEIVAQEKIRDFNG